MAVLLIGAVFLAYLFFSGVGLAWLLIPGDLRGRTALFAPAVGAAFAITAAHWFAFLGMSSGVAVAVTLGSAAVANLLALSRVVREGGLRPALGALTPDARRRAAAVAAIGVAVFLAASSPLFSGKAGGPAVIGHNGDAITHLLLSESFGNGGFAKDIFDSNPNWTEYTDYPFRPLRTYLVGSLALVDQASVITGRPHFETYSILGALGLAIAVVSVLLLLSPAGSSRWRLAAPVFLACNALVYSLLAEDYVPQICAMMLLPAALASFVLAMREPRPQSVLLAALVAGALLLTNPFGVVVLAAASCSWLLILAVRDGPRSVVRPVVAAAVIVVLAFALNPLAAIRAAGGVGARASTAFESEKGAFGEEFSLKADAAFGFLGLDRCPPSPYMEVRGDLFGRGCGTKTPLWKAYRSIAWPVPGLFAVLLAIGVFAAARRREDTLLSIALAAVGLLFASSFVDAYTFFKACTYALVPAAALFALGIEEPPVPARGRSVVAPLFLGVVVAFQCIAGGNFLQRYAKGAVLADRPFLERVEHVRRNTKAGDTVLFSVPLNYRWWYQYFLRDRTTAWMRDAAVCAQPRMRSLHRKECSPEAFARARKNADFRFRDSEEGYSLERTEAKAR